MPEPRKFIRCASCGTEKRRSQFPTSEQAKDDRGEPAVCQECIRERKGSSGISMRSSYSMRSY